MDRTLVPFTPEDIHHVFRGLSHPDVVRYYAISFASLEATQEQMDWFAALERDGTGWWRAIRATENNTFLGAIGIYKIDRQHRRCEIGYWLLPEHWGKGIASWAMPLVIDHAFSTLGLHRIEAQVETENHASRKLLERFGFKHEGTLRESEWKDGKAISLDVFALLGGERVP
ncbi:MAG: GNAT family N-acetyltransferase [Flavobacteriales bacterium]|nr:MAG: GNAT family N-acetyltransferase [Flavobacteriales bacterium]